MSPDWEALGPLGLERRGQGHDSVWTEASRGQLSPKAGTGQRNSKIMSSL